MIFVTQHLLRNMNHFNQNMITKHHRVSNNASDVKGAGCKTF